MNDNTMNDNIQPDTAGESIEYKLFVDKFKPKKTTDDCYTPPPPAPLIP